MNEMMYNLIVEVSNFKKCCVEFKRAKQAAAYKYQECYFNCREAVHDISEAFNKVEAEYNRVAHVIAYADKFIIVGNDEFISTMLMDLSKFYAEANDEFLDYINKHSENKVEAQLTRKGLGLTGRID